MIDFFGGKQGYEFSYSDLLFIIYSSNRADIWVITTFAILDVLFRLGFSVLVLSLLESIASQLHSKAYIYAALLAFCWYLSQLCKYHAVLRSFFLLLHIKTSLTMLLYSKISSMGPSALKSSDLGKVTNLLVSELSALDMSLDNIMLSFSFPVVLVGIAIILVCRVGWVGIVGVFLFLLFIPISILISKKNGDIISESNKFKDERVDLTAQIIEGIKSIKLYGWELAFKKIVQKVREGQLSNL